MRLKLAPAAATGWLVCVFALVLLPFSAAADEPQMTITATEGQEFKGQVVEVTGLQCDQASDGEAKITWGDGHVSSGTVTFLGNRRLTVSAGIAQGDEGHTYTAAGKYDGTVAGTYSCQGDAAEFSGASFIANVTAAKHVPPPPTETTPTTPTPPPFTTPPPSTPAPLPPAGVRAAFGVVSLTPGRAVLDATASVPPGASATSYSWNVTGGSHPDAVCKGSEPQLTVMTRGALDTTVSLTATDAQGAATTVQAALDIPAPSLRAARAARASVVHAEVPATRRTVGTPVGPSFTVLGECSGARMWRWLRSAARVRGLSPKAWGLALARSGVSGRRRKRVIRMSSSARPTCLVAWKGSENPTSSLVASRRSWRVCCVEPRTTPSVLRS